MSTLQPRVRGEEHEPVDPAGLQPRLLHPQVPAQAGLEEGAPEFPEVHWVLTQEVSAVTACHSGEESWDPRGLVCLYPNGFSPSP